MDYLIKSAFSCGLMIRVQKVEGTPCTEEKNYDAQLQMFTFHTKSYYYSAF